MTPQIIRKILVAGGDALKREGLRLKLEAIYSEASIQTASSVGALSGKERPDIILCGANMQEMEGGEFLEGVKTLASNVPVVVISGPCSQQKIEELLEGGAKVLIEPFDLGQAIDSITEAMLVKKQFLCEGR